MHSDKSYANFQARIADGALSYSPETSAALHAHARAIRAAEISALISRAANALSTRLTASFRKARAPAESVAPSATAVSAGAD
ncbi:MAG: hypothetical protein AB7O88_01215 [Reyranellaceae bacterium]